MKSDARELPEDRELQTDVCIVGAGAAGMTLALELARRGVASCLLEGGGEQFEPEVQNLYAGPVDGPYYPLAVARLRWLGGTTNHWAGHSPPLEPEAFGLRPWVSDLGWPIDRASLAPWYEVAARYLELGPEPELERTLPLDPTRIETRILRFSPPTRFRGRWGPKVEGNERVELILHANVTGIRRERETARIDAIEAATLTGRRLRVRARNFVVAAGGIENARLLLASNDVETAGLGNAHDQVGRYFMDHLSLPDGGRWMLAERLPTEAYEWPEGGLRGRSLALLAVAPDAAAREAIGGFHSWLDWSSPGRQSAGWQTLRRLRGLQRNNRLPDDLMPEIRKIVRDLGGVLEGAREEIFGFGEGSFASFHCEAEQRPDPGNRVTLAEERDALGMPRGQLRWRIGDEDLRTLDRGRWILAEAIGGAGLGRVQIDPGEAWQDTIVGAFHHMGTTRMATDPRRGVVDADCRVHGMANLYIAGSSVFPTSGVANPTFTLVALAARLSAHLAEGSAA